MSTNASIAIELVGGRISGQYLHWDGYISGAGKILNDHYQNPDKILDLIELGDLSVLGNSISECRPYEEIHGCVWDDYKTFLKDMGQEYNYLWRNNEWVCTPQEDIK